MPIVDSCVIIAAFNPTEVHHSWSVRELETIPDREDLVTPDIVFAEVSQGLETIDDARAVWNAYNLRLAHQTERTLFRAGQAFKAYKKNGGPKSTLLADLLIGAFAVENGLAVLTHDDSRFRTYFPEVELRLP